MEHDEAQPNIPIEIVLHDLIQIKTDKINKIKLQLEDVDKNLPQNVSSTIQSQFTKVSEKFKNLELQHLKLDEIESKKAEQRERLHSLKNAENLLNVMLKENKDKLRKLSTHSPRNIATIDESIGAIENNKKIIQETLKYIDTVEIAHDELAEEASIKKDPDSEIIAEKTNMVRLTLEQVEKSVGETELEIQRSKKIAEFCEFSDTIRSVIDHIQCNLETVEKLNTAKNSLKKMSILKLCTSEIAILKKLIVDLRSLDPHLPANERQPDSQAENIEVPSESTEFNPNALIQSYETRLKTFEDQISIFTSYCETFEEIQSKIKDADQFIEWLESKTSFFNQNPFSDLTNDKNVDIYAISTTLENFRPEMQITISSLENCDKESTDAKTQKFVAEKAKKLLGLITTLDSQIEKLKDFKSNEENLSKISELNQESKKYILYFEHQNASIPQEKNTPVCTLLDYRSLIFKFDILLKILDNSSENFTESVIKNIFLIAFYLLVEVLISKIYKISIRPVDRICWPGHQILVPRPYLFNYIFLNAVCTSI